MTLFVPRVPDSTVWQDEPSPSKVSNRLYTCLSRTLTHQLGQTKLSFPHSKPSPAYPCTGAECKFQTGWYDTLWPGLCLSVFSCGSYPLPPCKPCSALKFFYKRLGSGFDPSTTLRNTFAENLAVPSLLGGFPEAFS